MLQEKISVLSIQLKQREAKITKLEENEKGKYKRFLIVLVQVMIIH